jgi:hypothetical protein
VRIVKHTHIPVLLALLLGGAGVSGLHAQESESPLSYLFKIRFGLTAGDMRDRHFDNKLIGFGAELRYDVPAIGGAVSGELTYEYVPGRHHDVIPWGNVPSHLNINMRRSFDDRMEYGQGWSVRFAYSAKMPVFGPEVVRDIVKDFEWFGGIGIDRHRVRHEAAWNFRNSTNIPIDSNTMPPLYPNGAGSFDNEDSAVVIGAFAGLKYRIHENLGCELTLRNFGMRTWDFTPGILSALGTPDKPPEAGTTRGWSLEIALSLKL